MAKLIRGMDKVIRLLKKELNETNAIVRKSESPTNYTIESAADIQKWNNYFLIQNKLNREYRKDLMFAIDLLEKAKIKKHEQETHDTRSENR